jgi:hypothetical protein
VTDRRLTKLGLRGARVGTIHSVSLEIVRKDGPQLGCSFNVEQRGLLR